MNIPNNFEVLDSTDNFTLYRDTMADAFDLEKPSFYIIFKSFGTVEYATKSIIQAKSILGVVEDQYQFLTNPPVDVGFAQPEQPLNS